MTVAFAAKLYLLYRIWHCFGKPRILKTRKNIFKHLNGTEYSLLFPQQSCLHFQFLKKILTGKTVLWRRIMMVEITKTKSYKLPLSTRIINQMVYHITGKMTELRTTTETWKMDISWLFHQISWLSIWKGE